MAKYDGVKRRFVRVCVCVGVMGGIKVDEINPSSFRCPFIYIFYSTIITPKQNFIATKKATQPNHKTL